MTATAGEVPGLPAVENRQSRLTFGLNTFGDVTQDLWGAKSRTAAIPGNRAGLKWP
ncbi:MAG TPA: hypothetical protein VGD71_22375 [Kribbella sp.]|jgi:hypothetical protein